jgi:hypothetical protein
MKKRSIVADSPEPSHPTAAPEAAKVRRPLEGAEFVIAAAVPAQWPEAGPAEIAFAGRSNAGKSSAINVLARRPARVRKPRQVARGRSSSSRFGTAHARRTCPDTGTPRFRATSSAHGSDRCGTT